MVSIKEPKMSIFLTLILSIIMPEIKMKNSVTPLVIDSLILSSSLFQWNSFKKALSKTEREVVVNPLTITKIKSPEKQIIQG